MVRFIAARSLSDLGERDHIFELLRRIAVAI
jgi:hypothetical protein